jgi:hypothetical protein
MRTPPYEICRLRNQAMGYDTQRFFAYAREPRDALVEQGRS